MLIYNTNAERNNFTLIDYSCVILYVSNSNNNIAAEKSPKMWALEMN
jgi:hypothetical protein